MVKKVEEEDFLLKKSIYDLFFAKGVLLYITVYNVDGELVEWSKAPHWKCGVPQGTEGSNPSLSAIFFAQKKWRTKPQGFSYERLFVKFYLRKNRKKVDNQRKMILKSCFCLAPIRVL